MLTTISLIGMGSTAHLGDSRRQPYPRPCEAGLTQIMPTASGRQQPAASRPAVRKNRLNGSQTFFMGDGATLAPYRACAITEARILPCCASCLGTGSSRHAGDPVLSFRQR